MSVFDIRTLVDTDFTQSWYTRKGLPPQLALAVEAASESLSSLDIPAMSAGRFTQLLQHSLVTAERPNAPAHGNLHASRVVYRAQQAITALEQLLGHQLPAGLVQQALLGYARHDWMHPAAAFFVQQDTQDLITLPYQLRGVHSDYSVEYVTATWVDEQNEGDGISTAGRLLQTYVIWASTMGSNTECGRELQLETFAPQGFFGCLMRAVDVTLTNDFVANQAFEADLFCIEKAASPLATTVEGYVANRRGFLAHIASAYDALDQSAQAVAVATGATLQISFTEYLGWRGILKTASNDLEALATNPDDLRWPILNSMLELRGAHSL